MRPSRGFSEELVGIGPVTKIAAAEARLALSEVLNRVSRGRERIVITRRGKCIAAVVPIDDLRVLEQFEDQADARAVRKALREGGKGISLEEVKKRYGL